MLEGQLNIFFVLFAIKIVMFFYGVCWLVVVNLFIADVASRWHPHIYVMSYMYVLTSVWTNLSKEIVT